LSQLGRQSGELPPHVIKMRSKELTEVQRKRALDTAGRWKRRLPREAKSGKVNPLTKSELMSIAASFTFSQFGVFVDELKKSLQPFPEYTEKLHESMAHTPYYKASNHYFA